MMTRDQAEAIAADALAYVLANDVEYLSESVVADYVEAERVFGTTTRPVLSQAARDVIGVLMADRSDLNREPDEELVAHADVWKEIRAAFPIPGSWRK